MTLLIAALQIAGPRWTLKQAEDWGARQRWSAGCNFTPSTAVNQLEMWQADTFDPATIDRELGWMHSVGMSRARVYLHDLAYEQDPKGFKKRMADFLKLADKHQVKVMFCIFDDCWNPHPKAGRQPAPLKGVHNSGWVRSPGDDRRSWPGDLARLKTYVQDIVKSFARDKRVWMWDLYNEPGNSGYGEKSATLLRDVFEWAREVRPDQPLTAGAWQGGSDMDKLCLELSDVTSFHCYEGVDVLEKQIAFYKSYGRPVVCTEWMARTNNSLVTTHLPVFKAADVSCLQWGFVSGKTNTIFPWGSKEGGEEPKVWFHDLLRADGTPFDPAEVDTYRRLCRNESG